jgi:hypothetical protein
LKVGEVNITGPQRDDSIATLFQEKPPRVTK